MFVNSRVTQAGILVALELVYSVIHQGAVEDAKAHEQFKILHAQAGDFLKKPRLQLGYDILCMS